MKKIIIAFWLSFAFCFNAHAAVYYIDPVNGDDDDDGTTQALAWATFDYAQDGANPNQLSAGDTLYLMDGTYDFDNQGTNPLLNITVSGTEGNPITFKAINDGQATIDGEGSYIPCEILGTDPGGHLSYIDIEGIIFKSVVDGQKTFRTTFVDYMNIRRVSIIGEGEEETMIQIGNSTYVLLEDCLIKGKKTYPVHFSGASQYCTIRRVYVYWMGEAGGGGAWLGINLYPANDCIVENCYVSKPAAVTSDADGMGTTGIGAQTDNNQFLGCISLDMEGASGHELAGDAARILSGNLHRHCVSIRCGIGFFQRTDDSWTGENLTLVGIDTTDTDYGVHVVPHGFASEGTDINGDMKNSSLLVGNIGLNINDTASPPENIGTWTHTYNSYYGFTDNFGADADGTEHATEYCSENGNAIDPNYDTVTYGDGAYLMASQCDLAGLGEGGGDIGAEVLYQYVNGSLTNTPLWPWPMEDRIFAETGISVTWEANGGIWKTLDGVYSVPIVSFAEPDIGGDTVQVGDNYNIVYTLTDADYVGTSTGFYYDTDETGFDGTLIHADTVGLAEGTSQTYIWDTTGMAAGVYFIYGEVANDNSDTGQAYANGTLTINASIP